MDSLLILELLQHNLLVLPANLVVLLVHHQEMSVNLAFPAMFSNQEVACHSLKLTVLKP